jgi:hypothetical protein
LELAVILEFFIGNISKMLSYIYFLRVGKLKTAYKTNAANTKNT